MLWRQKKNCWLVLSDMRALKMSKSDNKYNDGLNSIETQDEVDFSPMTRDRLSLFRKKSFSFRILDAAYIW